MPSYVIDGRALNVRACTLGDVKRHIRPFQDFLTTKPDGEAVLEKTAALILHFVADNEGVTLEWVEDRLPIGAEASMEILRGVLSSAGGVVAKKDDAPGEAASQ